MFKDMELSKDIMVHFKQVGWLLSLEYPQGQSHRLVRRTLNMIQTLVLSLALNKGSEL